MWKLLDVSGTQPPFTVVVMQLLKVQYLSQYFAKNENKILKHAWVIEKKRFLNKANKPPRCHNSKRVWTPPHLFVANGFIWRSYYNLLTFDYT